MLGIVLGELMCVRLVEEEEEEEGEDKAEDECICAGWAAATSAAWTLGNRKQKENGLTLWRKPCSRPVLSAPSGPKSACRLCRAQPATGRSGRIMLQLTLGSGGVGASPRRTSPFYKIQQL